MLSPANVLRIAYIRGYKIRVSCVADDDRLRTADSLCELSADSSGASGSAALG